MSAQTIPRLDWPYLIGARSPTSAALADALDHLRSLFGERVDPVRLIEPVARILARNQKIAVIALSDETIGPGHSHARKIEGHLLAESHRGGVVKRYLVMTNPACSAAMPPETLQRLYSALSL